MKLYAQRSFLSYLLDRVAGALLKSNNPSDYGRFIQIKVDGKKLSFSVLREDFIANVTIDANLVNDDAILRLDEDGCFSVLGEQLVQIISKTHIDGPVILESQNAKEMFSRDESGDEDGGETEGPKAVGAARIELTGLGGKKEEFWLQLVESPVAKSITASSSAITVPADVFSKYITQIGVAAGDKSQSVEKTHIRIGMVKDKMEIVAFDGYRLGWIRFDAQCQDPFFGLAPYENVVVACRLLAQDSPVNIHKCQDGPEGLLFSQSANYGSSKVGDSNYRLFSMSDRFAKFEQTIQNLDFRFSCKAKTQHLRHICQRLAIIEQVRTQVNFDPKASAITFAKMSDKAKSGPLNLPVTDTSGEDLELFMSSRFLIEAAAHCSSDDVEIKFSGKKSLMMMTLGPGFKLFIQPFAHGNDE